MKKITISLFSLFTLMFSLDVYSQVDLSEPDRINCGTAVIYNQRIAEDPSLIQLMDAQNNWAKEYAKGHVSNKGAISYIIPVVYHVIHNNGPENVSKATIEASVQNLNEDFQKLNSDITQVVAAFTGITADIEVEFRLAHIDPNGNCTEGITRTVSTLTYAMSESAKSLVNWNTTKYLNIWVGQTMASGSGGWSYYPGTAPSQNNEGIVIRSAQLGNSITHEVGHFLNLPHLWGSSNTPNVSSNCSIDDGITDTPLCMGSQSCNTSLVTCGSLDNVQNYMEYSGCSRMFTNGQKTRMHAALNSSWGSRNTLWTSTNLAATGVANPYSVVTCAPVAVFSYNKEFICEGAAVSFTDNSYNAIPTAWNWTFNGGTPNASPSQNPTIIYNTAGTYSVTHQPSSSAGIGTETKTNIITVSSLTATFAGSLVDDFESSSSFSANWMINNPQGQGWQRNNVASTSGSNSVRIRNYFTSNDGEEDELISESYNISSVATKTMTFKQAYVRKNSSNSDRLLVYYSTDCGATWILKLPITTSTLSTAPDQTSLFTPTSSDWITRTVDLTAIANETNVRFKFLFRSGGGNDIYIDDINVGDGTIGVEDYKNNLVSFVVYPNPASSNAKISFKLTENVKSLSVKVKNAVGQEITSVIEGEQFNIGKYTLKIDEQRKLASGIYFVEIKADDTIKVQKLIIQ